MSRVVGKQAPFWCQQMCPFDYQRESRNGDFGGTFWSWAYRWLSGKESACKAEDSGDPGSIPGSGLFPWRRKWQPSPVFLPGESHGQSSLVGYSTRGCKESDMIELLTLSPFHSLHSLIWNPPLRCEPSTSPWPHTELRGITVASYSLLTACALFYSSAVGRVFRLFSFLTLSTFALFLEPTDLFCPIARWIFF